MKYSLLFLALILVSCTHAKKAETAKINPTSAVTTEQERTIATIKENTREEISRTGFPFYVKACKYKSGFTAYEYKPITDVNAFGEPHANAKEKEAIQFYVEKFKEKEGLDLSEDVDTLEKKIVLLNDAYKKMSTDRVFASLQASKPLPKNCKCNRIAMSYAEDDILNKNSDQIQTIYVDKGMYRSLSSKDRAAFFIDLAFLKGTPSKQESDDQCSLYAD